MTEKYFFCEPYDVRSGVQHYTIHYRETPNGDDEPALLCGEVYPKKEAERLVELLNVAYKMGRAKFACDVMTLAQKDKDAYDY